MTKKISQREARYLRKRVAELEAMQREQKDRWSSQWQYGWVNIESLIIPDTAFAKIETARKLKHAIVAIPGNGREIHFYADSLK